VDGGDGSVSVVLRDADQVAHAVLGKVDGSGGRIHGITAAEFSLRVVFMGCYHQQPETTI
jgi:hypothetical protein